MRVVLTVIAGPHKGLEFTFDRHDTFLVGRSKHAHFQLPTMDKYFSRIHFMMEVNPPQCRLIDMGSHNGTYVNGEKSYTADLKDGDQIRAGHTILRIHVERGMPFNVVNAPAATGLPVIAGYRIEQELGRGAMGVTYRGQRVTDAAPMALKIVTPSFQGAPQQIAQFLRSARRLTRIEHPNVIALRDVGVCPPGFFFASNFVPGLDAVHILKRDGPLSIRRTLSWAEQLLVALEYAHAQNALHLDIKPTNILVRDEGGKEVAMLADFGIARVYQSAPFSGLSLTTGLLELASFIPPEVLFNYQESNPLSDQYSVAAVIYYLLTAKPVLDLPTDERRKYSSLLRRQYVPIVERRADVPPALAAVIHKALSRTPNQRYKDVAAFGQALKNART